MSELQRAPTPATKGEETLKRAGGGAAVVTGKQEMQ